MLELTPRLTATFSNPASAGAYASGDLIANSVTASAVVPLAFPLQNGFTSGMLHGARCTVKPASGNLVITAFDFDLLLFRDAPFADAGYPADNAALAVTETMFRNLIGVFAFTNAAWRNPAGLLTAGAAGWQAAAPVGRQRYVFSLLSAAKNQIYGLVQCKGAWTPTAIINRFDFDLDLELRP